MTDVPLPLIACKSCGQQIPRESKFCLACGAPTTPPGPARPRSLTAIAACGILTAGPTLYWNLPWATQTGPRDAYQIFNHIFDWIGFPLNIILLAASIGCFLPPKPWVCKWMLWWAGLITIYETAQLLIFVTWIAPHVQAADLGDMPDLSSTIGSDLVQTSLNIQYSVYWVSMLSLALWAWWVLRRPTSRDYFEKTSFSNSPPPM